MKASVRNELLNHLLDLINDGVLTNDNSDEWHYHAFNEDYYIIGYWNASQWLKKHDIDAFDAIAEVAEYQESEFGEITLNPGDYNSETIVNNLVYFYGYELLSDLNESDIDELKARIVEELGE